MRDRKKTSGQADWLGGYFGKKPPVGSSMVLLVDVGKRWVGFAEQQLHLGCSRCLLYLSSVAEVPTKFKNMNISLV